MQVKISVQKDAKILLFFLAAMSLFHFSHAQRLHFGPKIGINLNNIHKVYDSIPEPIPENITKVGLNAGALLRVDLIKGFGIQIEGQYSVRKSRSELNATYPDTTGIPGIPIIIPPGRVKICTSLSTEYVEIPLLLTYSYKFISVQVGAQYAFALSNFVDLDLFYFFEGTAGGFGLKLEEDSFDADVDGYSDWHRDDWGLLAGISIEHPKGPFLSLRYSRSLSPFETKAKQRPIPDGGWGTKTYHRLFQISVGWLFTD